MITYENFRFLRDGEPLNDGSLNLLTFCERCGLCPIRMSGGLQFRTMIYGSRVFVRQPDGKTKVPGKKFFEAVRKAIDTKLETWSFCVENNASLQTATISFLFEGGTKFSIWANVGNDLDFRKRELYFVLDLPVDTFTLKHGSVGIPKAACSLVEELGIIKAIKAEIAYDLLS